MMDTLRELFPVTKDYVYLNSSAVGPLALPVKEAIEQWSLTRVRKGMDGAEAVSRQQELRRKVARLIGASPEEIAILHSTSEGICTVANGLDWQQGDNVITNDLENPANIVPWLNLRARRGVEVRKVVSHNGRLLPEDLFAAVDERTKVLTVAFVEWTSGFRNDLEAIGDFCRENGIYLLVDAIQGLGVLEFDVKRIKVDFMAAGAAKWLLGPIGIGCFFCRRELFDELQPTYASYGSIVTPADICGEYEYLLRPTAERYETGARNLLGIYGFNASLDIIEQATVKRIQEHTQRLTDVLINRLKENGYQILSSLQSKERSAIISFAHHEHEPEKLLQCLLDSNVIVSLRARGIRVGVHLFNNEEDIERLLEALPRG